MKTLLTIAALAAAMVPVGASAAPACSTALTPDQAVQLQMRMFDALGREDRGAWDEIAAPDFRAFENGKELTKDSFFQILLDVHKSGRRIRWSVTEPRVEADCNLATLSYVNVGSIALNGGEPAPVRWFETAAYRRTSDGWRLFLVTSERTADTPPTQ